MVENDSTNEGLRMTSTAQMKHIMNFAIVKLLNRTLQLDSFLGLLPEYQLAALIEAEDLLKDPEVEQDARSQLLQLITAIASCSKITGDVKVRAISLIPPCPDLPF